jgi:NTP pyrophosphatase (non-canonical NTP hydrolase)
LEHFRFKSKEEVEAIFDNSKTTEEVEAEMADVLYFLLRMAQIYDIDLSEALENKMKENREKYPVEKSKGSNKKYDKLE